MQGQQLQKLLKSSDYISQILEQLKHNILQNTQQKNPNDQDAIEYIEKAIDLKMSFRYLADGIETNRALVQAQKQQIQKKKVFLEGLQYYKATLKNQISSSVLDVVSVNDYLQEEPCAETNWIQDFKTQEKKILNTMQQFKQKKSLYEQKQIKKSQLSKQIQQSQQKYKKTFPQQIRKLYNQVSETSKIFNIKQIDTLSISEFKSKKIERIHTLLYPLKLKGFIEIRHAVHSDTEQLQITVEKGFFNLYEYAKQNKIMVEEKQFKFFIASVFIETQLNKQEVMTVSIPRRQDFSTEEIFDDLFLQQKVRPIFQNPISEIQRNTNNKYSRLNWIGQVLAAPTTLINGSLLIEKIKKRVFSLNLIRHAFQNITKKIPPYFFPLFRRNEDAIKLINYPILQAKRLLITKCQKVNFEEYKREIFIPGWITKALQNYAILRSEKNYIAQKLETFNSIDRQSLNQFIQQNNLQQLQIKGFYSYFKFEMAVQKSLLIGFFLLPNDYPNRRSAVRLTSFRKAGDPNQSYSAPKQLVLAFEQKDLEIKNPMFTEELDLLQVELNERIDQFLRPVGESNHAQKAQEIMKKKQPFLLYFQINRLYSLFIQKSLKMQKIN